MWGILLFYSLVVCSGILHVSGSGAEAEPFIIGGRQVQPANKWPGVAAIYMFGNFTCHGALINHNHVVSSYLCPLVDTGLEVVLGLHRLNSRQGTQRIPVSGVFRHERFGEGDGIFPNNIALLRLRTPARITSNVNIFLMARADIVSNACYYVGWSKLSATGQISNVMLEGRATTMTNSACGVNMWPLVDRNSHTCTTGSKPCGSAALPLMCPRGGNYYLTGISVFGSGRNCDASQPYVATRIPAFIQWISSKINQPVPTGLPPMTRCSNVTTFYTRSGNLARAFDEVWCHMGVTGNLVLREGTGGRSITCTYAWRSDDGIYMIEMQCDGFTTRKRTFTLASAKAEALCSAKHSLMSRGPNKPVANTVAIADASPVSYTDPYVMVQCSE